MNPGKNTLGKHAAISFFLIIGVASYVPVWSFAPAIPQQQRVISSTIRSVERSNQFSVPSLVRGASSLSPDADSVIEVSAEEVSKSSTPVGDSKVSLLKEELFKIADRTNRGFNANSNDRKKCSNIISELARYNPTKNPAVAFYKKTAAASNTDVSSSPSVVGKWTLVYTDAPDITSLQQNPLAQLGRIGQECSPPYIKNVIEYTKPTWATNLPFSGDENSRILQKVVTKGSSSPDQPMKVNLVLSGLQIETDDNDDRSNESNTQEPEKQTTTDRFRTMTQNIQKNGLPSALLQSQPVNWNGPLDAPFGQFEILYLDDSLRIIRTGQNYIAVNIRQPKDNEWF